MAIERTLIIVKPDGVQRGLIGEIIQRLERRGLKLIALKLTRIDRPLAERHYGVHKDRPFYEGLVQYITSGAVVVGVLEGPSAIAAVDATVGKTHPVEAATGTIRGDLALSIGRNLIHRSDSAGAARSEIDLFFRPDELISYARDTDRWIIEE
ncbi:MAG TPA: nucleoside-diphosphate kinase [Thermomicrobiales bacterium]|nr:nucleoside-diphosphate kinase [Thermomicrobiales bacterium]